MICTSWRPSYPSETRTLACNPRFPAAMAGTLLAGNPPQASLPLPTALLMAPLCRLPFNFPHVGCTREAPPLSDAMQQERWHVNHTRVQLGNGRRAFLTAQTLLQQWRHFDLGWAWTNKPKVTPGAGVVVTACSLGLWSQNPLKISYVEERHWPLARRTGRRFAFGHATLKGHQISGEERFSVEWVKADDSVWYDVYSISRPATPLVALWQPLLHFYQRRFAAQSAAVMQLEVAAGLAGS